MFTSKDEIIGDAVAINDYKFKNHNLLVTNLYKVTFDKAMDEYNDDEDIEFYILAKSFEDVAKIVTGLLEIEESWIRKIEILEGNNKGGCIIFKPITQTKP